MNKLENLIPSHMEIDYDQVDITDYKLTLYLRPRELKSFEYYVSQYSKTKAAQDSEMSIEYLCQQQMWKQIPFELGMGLLKWICKDNGVTWNKWNVSYSKGTLHEEDVVSKICPAGFLEALFA